MSVNDSQIINNTNAVLKNQIVCYCLPDFHGLFCEQQYNECDPNPCLNDGICRDGIDSYVCACSLGFIGDLCEIDCSDPLKRPYCISPTTVFIDLKTSLYLSSSFIDISSNMSSFQYQTQTIQIYSSFENMSSFGLNSTSFGIFETPTISSYEFSNTLILSSLPFISLSSIASIMPNTTILPEIITSPKFYQNETMPTKFPIYSTKIFIPRFNGFNSSLIHYSKRTKRDSIDIELSFKTEKSEATILYSKGKENHELILYIEDNILKFYLSNNKQKILYIESSFRIPKNLVIKVDIQVRIRSDRKIYANISVLTDNETRIMRANEEFSSNSTHLCFDTFYLGELPINNNIGLSVNQSHLSGCIFKVYINRHEKLISDAIKGSDISECNPRNICSQNPCRNGATCMEDQLNWQCICPNGYKNTLCEEATCSQGICQNGGVCILQNSKTYLCICPHGWNGKYCELSES